MKPAPTSLGKLQITNYKLGNDLDLFTTADERRVVTVMIERFGAQIEPRSWGDRLANKWNFCVPGLREAVEVHARRLGQTGEHTDLARRFIRRRVSREIGGYTSLVPAPEERLIEAALQRMYRHFYFRVCDIVDTATLADAQSVDYAELQGASEQAGIWPGVATFLRVVSDWTERYRGQPLVLPQTVLFGRALRRRHGWRQREIPARPALAARRETVHCTSNAGGITWQRLGHNKAEFTATLGVGRGRGVQVDGKR